ncbi:hypothetical protein U1Q18_019350 [Sarracenia purpurea var. burkii]
MAASTSESHNVVINDDAINVENISYNNATPPSSPPSSVYTTLVPRIVPPDFRALELPPLENDNAHDSSLHLSVPMVQRRPPQTGETYFLHRQETTSGVTCNYQHSERP